MRVERFLVEAALLELFLALFPELLLAELLRAEVPPVEPFFAVELLRAVDLLAPPRLVLLPLLLAVLLPLPDRLAAPVLLVELLLRAPVLVPLVLVPLVLVPLVRELDLRPPAVGDAALRAAVFRRGVAPEDVDADLDDDVDDRSEALPVREPALRLELLGDDFLVAMLYLRNEGWISSRDSKQESGTNVYRARAFAQ